MTREEFYKLYKEWQKLEKTIKSILESNSNLISRKAYKFINGEDILRQNDIKKLLKPEKEYLKELTPADRFEIRKE